ncbi:molybdenum cofactor guanylyltransferase [Marinifilum flexuosum]|uniref:Probable molybdenum cofactor guanylyltransferase n=1 Tax=Marinifilum flexuosum TaxID=1117708 RepID=A0A419X3T4_9BACT|nr:molybdenum cofactor guanylyltransferase [Marinifilum flexuosum]RKE02363.1 molybdenum cofactor guanylyltransferase [Marinifilum flexuosum]
MIQEKKSIGIVLSGGKSSRMGTEKGLVKWQSKALIEYSVKCLNSICNNIVISSNNEDYNYLNLPVIKDEIANCGPIGGIYSCMKNISADYYYVISCDVPNVPTELFKDLFKNIREADLIYAVDSKGKKQPLVAIYKRSCFLTIESELLNGNYKMMKLLEKIKAKEYLVTQDLKYYRDNILSNANSPEDLNNL